MAKYPITISVFSTGCRAASGDAELRRSTKRIPTANKKARLKKKAILEKNLKVNAKGLKVKNESAPVFTFQHGNKGKILERLFRR